MTREISIHAPREGSDLWGWPASSATSYFYPRSPRGERLSPLLELYVQPAFLSTLPARGATAEAQNYKKTLLISIHAPREGSDTRP